VVKLTHSKGGINWGLVFGGLIGTVVPVVVTAATGGIGAVTIPMWVALAGGASALAAGNVEVKTKVERALDADAAKTSVDTDGE
jgi:hypothetical protein